MNRRKGVGPLQIAAAMLTASLLTMAFWREPDPRGLVVFAFCLAVAEIVMQMRWRMSLLCPVCGFDPVVYLKDPAKAASRVKGHMETRRQDPTSLFKPQPQLSPITAERALVLQKEETARVEAASRQKRGSFVSRSI